MISESQVKAILPKTGFVRDYVEWAGRRTDAHLIYHVGASIALLSMTIPPDVYFPFGGKIRANFYLLCVGDSAHSRKSAAVDCAEDVLAIKLNDYRLERPGSTEVLIDELISRPQRILFLGEFGSFLARSEAGNMASIRAQLTEIYDAKPISRTLVKRRGPQSVCQNPRLSVVAASAPDFLEEHTTDADWGGGFLGRFVTFLARRERLLDVPETNIASEEKLAALLASYAPDPLTGGAIRPCEGFTPEAMKLWSAWNRQIELVKAGGQVKAAVSRAPGHALKMAMILAWDLTRGRFGEPWSVDAETLAVATALTDLHVESVLELAEGFAGDRDMRDRRRVLRSINGTPTAFGTIIKMAKVTARRGREMLETLAAEGTVERRAIEGTTEPAYVSSSAPLPAVAPPSLEFAALFESPAPSAEPTQAPPAVTDPFA